LSKKAIILFTSSFPYGHGEQFLETELGYLAPAFDKIIIFPYHYGSSNEMRKGLPVNITVYKPFRDENHTFAKLLLKGLFNTKCFFPYWHDLYYHPEIMLSTQKLSLWFRSMLNCRMILSDKRLLNSISAYQSGLLFYFYWSHRPSGITLGLKNLKRPVVVRFHGTDLYTEMELNRNYIPFREKMLKSITHAVFISEHGARYVKKKYSYLPDQLCIHRLGTTDRGASSWQPSDVLRIVSCSTVDENKRTGSIAKVISSLNFPVEWTHIGDGPLMKDLIQQCQAMDKTGKTIRLLGRITNQDVHQVYQHSQFDLFINVSKSEGVPFSIMEALSYSIPVIATAAGGTPEIVDHACGHLLPVDFLLDDLKNALIDFHALDIDSKKTIRNNARQRWELTCDANRNYLKFKSFMESL